MHIPAKLTREQAKTAAEFCVCWTDGSGYFRNFEEALRVFELTAGPAKLYELDTITAGWHLVDDKK